MTYCEIVIRPQVHDGQVSWQAECDPHGWVTIRSTQDEVEDQVKRHEQVVRDRNEELRAAGLSPQ